MKKNRLTLLTLIGIAMMTAANAYQWIQKTNFPGSARMGTVFFTIGQKGYMGTGYNGTGQTDFWEYDSATDTWTQKANFASGARWSSRGMVSGTTGYIFGGNTQGYNNDLYAYNSLANTWSLVNNNCPIAGRQDSYSFDINGLNYITCGYGGIYYNDLWEYNAVTDVWTQKADFPGTARNGISGFVLNGEGYVGLGLSVNAVCNDFYKYIPGNNTWATVASFPGSARHSAVGFAVNGMGFAGMGANAALTQYPIDFYQYDATLDTWTASASFNNTGVAYPFIFQFGNTAYVGTGKIQNGVTTNTVYQFLNTTGLDENTGAAKMVTFSPNPFSDHIVIDGLKGKAVVKVFDCNGRQRMALQSRDAATTLNTLLLNKGVYGITVEDESGSHTFKAVKRE